MGGFKRFQDGIVGFVRLLGFRGLIMKRGFDRLLN